VTRHDNSAGPLHPLHAILLAFLFPLFLGALLSDYAYSSSFEIQWGNFSAWLIAGALVPGGFVLLWSFIEALRHRRWVYFLLVAATWLVGLINAFIHARDNYATMPTGLVLSIIAAILAFVASWVGFSGARRREVANA
jgi:uncharacterized membrane protein